MISYLMNVQGFDKRYNSNAETDKEKLFDYYVTEAFNQVVNIFEIENLPNTIPEHIFKLFTMFYGVNAFTKINDNYYLIYGRLGGEPNEYYLPTLFVYSNPYLIKSGDLKIGSDCVLMRNDSNNLGLYPIVAEYARNMVECDISIRLALINSRMVHSLVAKSEDDKKSIEYYLSNIIKGKLSALFSHEKIEGIKGLNIIADETPEIMQLIETRQYLLSQFYNKVGINTNFNMKRESLNSAETQLNDDILTPLVYDMFVTWNECISNINSKYGLNIQIKLSPLWNKNILTADSYTRENVIEDNTDESEVEIDDTI